MSEKPNAAPRSVQEQPPLSALTRAIAIAWGKGYYEGCLDGASMPTQQEVNDIVKEVMPVGAFQPPASAPCTMIAEELAAAFKRGQEEMREQAAKIVVERFGSESQTAYQIRSLPVEESK